MNIYAEFVGEDGSHVHVPSGFHFGQKPVFGPKGRPYTADVYIKSTWARLKLEEEYYTPRDNLTQANVVHNLLQPNTTPPGIRMQKKEKVERCVLRLPKRSRARFAIATSFM